MENAHKRIAIFTNKYPLVGPTFWIATVHYFVVQIIAAAYWLTPFSLRDNPISDLGNSACGEYAMRYVCSPLYTWMNASFILLGLLMIAGSTLIDEGFRRSKGSHIAFILMGLAGFGAVLVGMFPENTIPALHFIGAILAILVGNIAVLMFGFVLGLHGWFRTYTIATGLITIAATVLFFFGIYLGLGEGGMERLAAYPQTLWLIVFGVYLSRDRYRITHKKVTKDKRKLA